MGRLTTQHLSEVALIAARREAERQARKAEEAMREAQAAAASLAEEMDRRYSTEERLNYVSTHDMLTGLINRTEFSAQVGSDIRDLVEKGARFAILEMEVNQFKVINNRLGYAVGDELLRRVGQRLSSSICMDGIVARLEGERFGVCLKGIVDPAAVRVQAERIVDAFSEPVEIDHEKTFVDVSLGIALYPHDGTDVLALLRSANLALGRSKERGRNGYQFFDLALDGQVRRRAALEQALRFGLQERQFRLVYQPQVEFSSGLIIGVEALARWSHPELGDIAPAEFIPVAEQCGLIVELGDWVLRESCGQAMRWRSLGMPDISMAVNLSAAQIVGRDVVREVSKVLLETGLPPDRLELEITESGVMDDLRDGASVLTELRSLGVTLAIDDFGTGYSSLSYLRSLPVHRLKVDRSFVTDVTQNRDAAAIASTIVTLAHNLRLDVVAEGVETADHAAFFSRLGCASAQGYFYSRPLPGDEVTALLASGRSLVA